MEEGDPSGDCLRVSLRLLWRLDEPKFERNHRWNILNPEYTRPGVGIRKGSDGMLYLTEDFAQIR